MPEPATPRAERPRVPAGYGMPDDDEGMLRWSWVDAQFMRAANYWIASVRARVSPVWGVWLDGALYFDGSSETHRMRNIAVNPAVAVHLESGDEVVILEGLAGAVPVRDQEVSSGVPFPDSHSAYWAQERTFALLAECLP